MKTKEIVGMKEGLGKHTGKYGLGKNKVNKGQECVRVND